MFLSAGLVGEPIPGWLPGSFEKDHSDRLGVLAQALVRAPSPSPSMAEAGKTERSWRSRSRRSPSPSRPSCG